jgi:hypothetical protein
MFELAFEHVKPGKSKLIEPASNTQLASTRLPRASDIGRAAPPE